MAKIDEKPDLSGIGTTFRVVYTDYSMVDASVAVTTTRPSMKRRLDSGNNFTALMINEFRTKNGGRVCGYLKDDILYIIGSANESLEGRYKQLVSFYCSTKGTASYADSISLSLANQKAFETGVVSYGYPTQDGLITGFWEVFDSQISNRPWGIENAFFTSTGTQYLVGGDLSTDIKKTQSFKYWENFKQDFVVLGLPSQLYYKEGETRIIGTMHGSVRLNNFADDFLANIVTPTYQAYLNAPVREDAGTLYSINEIPQGFKAPVFYNLIITEDYDQAVKFVNDGTIPDDAWANIPKDPDPDGDGNASGESGGSHKNDIDTFEPSAPDFNSINLSNLHTYWITKDQMKDFYTKLWEFNWTDISTNLLTGIYSNLVSNVVSLKMMPTSPENLGGTGEAEAVVLGFKTFDDLIVQTIGTNACPVVTIGTINIKKAYKSYADYSPYTDIALYLPFVGVVPLDTNLFMNTAEYNGSTLTVKASYDMLGGTITYFIEYEHATVYQFTGNMAVDVPVSLQSGVDIGTALAQNASSAIATATNALTSVAEPKPIGKAVNTAVQNVSSFGGASASAQSLYSSTGGDGAFYAFPKCVLMIRRPEYNRPKTYDSTIGYPAFFTKKVADIKGFATVTNPKIPLVDGMTKEEHDMIVSAMQNGLYY